MSDKNYINDLNIFDVQYNKRYCKFWKKNQKN